MPALALLVASHVQAVCSDARATVLDLGVAQGDLPEADYELVGNPCRERPQLRVVGRKDGTIVRSFTLRPTLSLEKRGLVAVEATDAGKTVSTEPGWVPWSTLPVEPGTLVARHAIDSGDPIGRSDVVRRPDAEAGATVDLVVTRGSLSLKVTGRLLADCEIDAPARAVYPSTGAVVRGVLVDPKTVEVR